MARVSYERGIKCKKCGEMIVSFNRFKHCILCQNCGSHLMDFNLQTKEGVVTENADIITVKVTHKMFHDLYQEV